MKKSKGTAAKIAPVQPPKKRKRKKSKGRGLGIAILILLLLGAGTLLYFILRVDHVQVKGNERITTEQVLERAGIKEGTHMWLVDVSGARSALQADPYVRSATIVRAYPDTIRIVLTERHPRALVVGMSNVAVIDNEGHVLAIDDDAMDALSLMRVSGIGSVGFQVNQQLGELSEYSARALVDIIQAIDAAGLGEEIVSLDISNALSIYMETASGYRVLLGQPDNLGEKMQNLTVVLPELQERGYSGGEINLSARGAPTYSPPGAAAAATPTEPEDGALPGDGSAPEDGDVPEDGAAPEDGDAPEEGAAPEEGSPDSAPD